MAKEHTIKTIFALDGETRYRDAIKAINADQSLLYAEMGRVNNAYKENGDAIQFNRDKIRILNTQIELQTKKVNEARNALDQAKKAQDPDAVTRYTAEVIRAENGLSRMERELKAANLELEKQQNKLVQAGEKLKAFGEKAGNVGEKLTSVGNTLSKTVTAPLMALGGVSVKAAIDFETAMVGVRKTTELTDEEFADLTDSIREMAKEIPATTTEIGAIAEAAGQLGIKKENILGFTRTIVDLGVSSNLTGDEGAMMLAKFANITQMDQGDFDRLGSVIVELGNNTATTEKDIADMGMRIAAAGKQAGMSEADIMSYAAALSAAGMEAQAGGTAISRVITDIQLAVETGSDSLADFAAVAGMSVDDFSRAFKDDAAGALAVFIQGLGDAERNGKSAVQILDDMGIKEVRVSQALLRLAGSGDVLTDALKMGNNAWVENIALTNEAEMFYGTTANQLLVQKNRMNDVAITLGQSLIPHLTSLMEWLTGLVEKFNDLDPATQKTIITIAGLVAGLGPLLSIAGKTATGVSTLSKAVSTFLDKAGSKQIEATSTAIGGLGESAGKAAGSIGTGILGVGLVAALSAFAIYMVNAVIESKKGSEAFRELADAAERSEKAFEQTVDDINVSASAAQVLADQIFALADVEEKSAAQKEVLRRKIQQLNDLYPGLNLQIEEESGLINLSREAVEDYIEARKNQILQKAYEDRDVELVKEMIELQQEHAKVVEKLTEMQSQGKVVWSESDQKWRATWNWWLNLDVSSVINDFDKFSGALEDNAKKQELNAESQQDAANKIVDANERTASSAEDSADRTSEATKQAAEATAEHSAEQLAELQRLEQEQESYYSALQAAIAKHNRIMGGLEDEGVKKSELTGAQLVKNWNAQADDYEAWSKNLQGIAGRVPQGLYDELKEAGPKILPALEDMNSMSQEEFEAMIDAWTRKSQLAVDGAVDELSGMPGAAGEEGRKTVERVVQELFKMEEKAKKEGARGATGYATSFGSKSGKAQDEAGKVRGGALTGVSGGNFYGTGQQAGASYASGVSSKSIAAYNSGWSLASSSIAGIRARNAQASPSKVLLALGDEASESYVDGFGSNIDDAKEIGEELAKAVQDPLGGIKIDTPDLDAQIAAARQSAIGLEPMMGRGSVDKSKHNSMIVNIQVSDGATVETGKNVGRGFMEIYTRERLARGEIA